MDGDGSERSVLATSASVSRRAALLAPVLAWVPLPRIGAVLAEPGAAFKTDGVETSPLIEELKRRTEANKEKNAQKVKETTNSNVSSVYDSEREGFRLLRLDAKTLDTGSRGERPLAAERSC